MRIGVVVHGPNIIDSGYALKLIELLKDYGEVKASNAKVPTYSTNINNQYILGFGGPILPSTGSAVRMMYVFIGGGLMLLSVIWGIVLRCRRERRRGEAF